MYFKHFPSHIHEAASWILGEKTSARGKNFWIKSAEVALLRVKLKCKTYQQLGSAEKWMSKPGQFVLTSPSVFSYGNLELLLRLSDSRVRRCSVFVGSGVRTSQSESVSLKGRDLRLTWVSFYNEWTKWCIVGPK